MKHGIDGFWAALALPTAIGLFLLATIPLAIKDGWYFNDPLYHPKGTVRWEEGVDNFNEGLWFRGIFGLVLTIAPIASVIYVKTKRKKIK